MVRSTLDNFQMHWLKTHYLRAFLSHFHTSAFPSSHWLMSFIQCQSTVPTLMGKKCSQQQSSKHWPLHKKRLLFYFCYLLEFHKWSSFVCMCFKKALFSDHYNSSAVPQKQVPPYAAHFIFCTKYCPSAVAITISKGNKVAQMHFTTLQIS